MFRYVIAVAVFLPALCQAQDYQTNLIDPPINQQRHLFGGLCLSEERKRSPFADSEFTLQHRLSVERNSRLRTHLYVGILWSVVWGGVNQHASLEPIWYACNQRSTP